MKEQIIELYELQKQKEAHEAMIKEINKSMADLEADIVSALNQIDETELKFEHPEFSKVSVKYKPRVTIKGGSDKATWQRQEVLHRLEALGYGKDMRQYFGIDGKRLNQIFDELRGNNADVIDSMVADGLVSVFNQPEVKFK